MKLFRRVLGLLLLLIFISPASGEDAFYLKDGETIVFFGDSITQNGGYVTYVETYLRTRFPSQRFQIINRGISSETISGSSEPDHDPRRPDAQKRFARDVAAYKPDVVMACFGMNDGNYFPFEEPRFEQYQDGVRRLIERTRAEAGARLTLMTPPPFDPYRRQASDPMAKTYGYKFAAVDYDETLEKYSQWLMTLRKEGFVVADVHTAMSEHLRRRRERLVSFSLSPDAVHPDPTGHWMMAQTLLEAWNAPRSVAEVELDAAAPEKAVGQISDVKIASGTIEFTWQAPLPMPRDPRWDRESIQLEKFDGRLNRHVLIVRNAPAKRYGVSANGLMVAEVTREQLEQGLQLTDYPELPSNQRALEVLKLVQQRSAMLYDGWRKRIAGATGQPRDADSAESSETAAAMDERLRELCQPIELHLTLGPLADD